MLDIAGLWKAPFRIDRQTQVATYGSCFAQHFSRSLVERGYSWLNAETGMPGMPAELQREFSYGVFSARTGNIYTASLFRQWVGWALEGISPPPLHWEKDGRIHDPFRPTVEPGGFGSVAEMEQSRAHSIGAFRQSLVDCDLLVFTLGLTESWWDAQAGVEYPMCPGTHAGEFDPARHVFRNQDYGFVRDNIVDAITTIRKHRREGPKVLLTVSPVPLTATNSGKHVLVATMESKSVLRAVVGSVAASMADVSYFPSYELINSPVFRGAFFEPNLRSVSRQGVAHVMNCFFAGLDEDATTAARQPAVANPNEAPASDDVMCDEELLSAFGENT
ncbi:GSCFA domain-containing protein [Aestuariivirga sp.]|uniref:GSCFA domain-containing protein n=1 Tax=Aestuariivirga sp. TaxID=2650926 RepID=UPI0030178E32